MGDALCIGFTVGFNHFGERPSEKKKMVGFLPYHVLMVGMPLSEKGSATAAVAGAAAFERAAAVLVLLR